MFSTMFFTILISTVLVMLLTPTPEMPQAEKPNLDDFDIPTAAEDRVVQEVFGTVMSKGGNCIYFSDLYYEDITTSGGGK